MKATRFFRQCLRAALCAFLVHCGGSGTSSTNGGGTGGGTGGSTGTSSWLVGETGAMWSVTTGGQVLAHDTVTSANLYGLTCVGPSTAWAVGDGGVIFYTRDAGANWAAQTSGVSSVLRALSFDTVLHGVVTGDDGIILLTSDGGATWTSLASGVQSSITAVKLTPALGYAVTSDGAILQSLDDGASWTLFAQVTGALDGVDISADASHAVAVGRQTFTLGASGASAIAAPASLNAVHFLNDGVSFVAAGANGTAAVITASGTQILPTNTTASLHTLMVHNDAITLAGDNGTLIYFASPSGDATPLKSPSTAAIFSIDDLGAAAADYDY